MSDSKFKQGIVAAYERTFATATKLRDEEMDKEYHVIHISDEIIRNQMLRGMKEGPKITEALVAQLLWGFYNDIKNRQGTQLISNTQELETYLGLSSRVKAKSSRRAKSKKAVIFATITPTEERPADFVIIASSFRKARDLTSKAAKHLAKEANLAFLTKEVTGKDNVTRELPTFDLGHVGAGEFATQNTPALRYLQKVSAAFAKFRKPAKIAASSKALGEIEKGMRDIATVHRRAGSYTTSLAKTATMSELSGLFTFNYIVPQSKRLNNILSKIENRATTKFKKTIMDLKGSRSLVEHLDGIIHGALHGESYSKKEAPAKASGALKGLKPKLKLKKHKARMPKLKGGKSPKSGPSALQLMTLINLSLTQQVKDNMTRPALENQTGRFAESVKIQNATVGRAGFTTFQYDYAKSPYQTFENSSRWPKGYDPRPLIAGSIREIASHLMQTKFRSVRL